MKDNLGASQNEIHLEPCGNIEPHRMHQVADKLCPGRIGIPMQFVGASPSEAATKKWKFQGYCDRTRSARYFNPDCKCQTYVRNMGPCGIFEAGGNGRCAYCDHSENCHPQLGEINADPCQPSPEPGGANRFADFDDDDHPFRKWWEEHGQFMLSGGGRRESIWAARGWIAREQLGFGAKVTGDSMHEKSEARSVQQSATEPDMDNLAERLVEDLFDTNPAAKLALVKMVRDSLDRHFIVGPDATEPPEFEELRERQDMRLSARLITDNPCFTNSILAITTAYRDGWRDALEARNVQPSPDAGSPVPIYLTCPKCGMVHVDEGEWATRPHKTHQCQECFHEWRPFPYATVGIPAEARPVQQPAPEPIAAFLEIARAHIAEGIPAFDEAFARAALALRDVPQGPQMEVFSKLIAKWEEVYDAFTLPFYKVTKKPDAMKGLRQCIEELKEAIAEARQVPVGPEGKK